MAKLLQKFKDALGFKDHSQTQKRACVNYVWLNKDPLNHDDEQPMCGINLTLIDIAYQNARKYPNVDFNLWIDEELLDDKTQFFIKSHAYLNAPKNIKLRDINEIPDYEKVNELYAQPNKTNIWKRVDLARLLVMDHCFETQSNKDYIFYSDLDVVNVKLNNNDIWDRLNLGNAFFPMANSGLIENGYLAFKRGTGSDYLKHLFIPKTITGLESGDENGYRAFEDSFVQMALEQNISEFILTADIHIIEPMGYITQPDPFYQKINLN